MTERQLEIKAHNYLIRNNFLILKKLHDDVDHNLKEVLMDIYKDAYKEGFVDPDEGKTLKAEIDDLKDQIYELETEVIKTEILLAKNI